MFKKLTCYARQGHQEIFTSNSSIPFLKEGTNACQKPILWGFHPYQEIAETNRQILDLVYLLVPLELQDETHQDLNHSL